MIVAALAAALLAAAAGPELGELTPVRPFRSFDRSNSRGLPQSTVMALAQDAEGVLWLATLDGVARFEGTALESLTPGPEAPAAGAFYTLVRRRQGGILVGGSQGVHAWDGGRWRFEPSKRTVVSLAERADGELFLVDQEGKLRRRDRSGDWNVVALPEALGPAVTVAAGERGALWVAGRTGVASAAGATSPQMAPAGPFGAPLTALLVSTRGVVWVGTQEGGLFFLSPGAADWTRVDNPGWAGGRIRCLAEDRRGRVWAGGNDGQVAFGWAEGAWTRWGPPNGLKRAAVMAMLADREGTVWFGLNGNGVQQWVSESWTHRTRWAEGEPDAGRPAVFGIRDAAGQGLLAAVFGRGVWHWDGRRLRTLGKEQGLTEDARIAVEPQPGTLWVGTRFGIFESKAGGPFRKTLSLEDGFVTGLHLSPGGVWYAATSAFGLFLLQDGTWRPAGELNTALPDPHVRDLLWRGPQELWVATIKGVVVFRNGRPEPLAPDPEGGVSGAAHCLLAVGSEVWVGGYGGLAIYRDGRLKGLTPTAGFPGRTIYSLARDAQGGIWAGGSEGVGRYAGGNWTRYDSRRGLIDDECNLHGLLVAGDGTLWVGTMGSLARFDPALAPLPPPPLRLFWRQTPPRGADGVARLGSRERRLSLAWSAPWLAPGAVWYRSRVSPLQSDFGPASLAPGIEVENLGPGRYRIQVEARLEGEPAWSEPLRLEVEVAPRAWETWWARGALLVLVVSGALGAVRLRTRQLRRRAEELQAAVERELADTKVLRGLLPICSSCKKVRDDSGYWSQIESYIREHSEAEFSHGLCPGCMKELYPAFAAKLRPRE